MLSQDVALCIASVAPHNGIAVFLCCILCGDYCFSGCPRTPPPTPIDFTSSCFVLAFARQVGIRVVVVKADAVYNGSPSTNIAFERCVHSALPCSCLLSLLACIHAACVCVCVCVGGWVGAVCVCVCECVRSCVCGCAWSYVHLCKCLLSVHVCTMRAVCVCVSRTCRGTCDCGAAGMVMSEGKVYPVLTCAPPGVR